jgi:hypothetical protein
MRARLMPWKSRLRHPLHLADGRTLHTLDDVRSFIGSLPERRQRDDRLQRISALIASAAQANNAALTAIVTDRLAETLRSLNELLEKRPPAPSVRRRRAAQHRRSTI